MATSPTEKARAEAQKKLYAQTVALPAEESRKLAIAQQAKLSERLRQYRDKFGGVLGRWKQFDEDVAAIAQHIQWGDELTTKTDDDSRKVRRQQYARAYLRGRTAAQNLDSEIADGSTFEVVFRDVVAKTAEVTTKAGEVITTAAEKTAEKVEQIVEGVSEGLWVGVAGLVAALLLYANQKGKR